MNNKESVDNINVGRVDILVANKELKEFIDKVKDAYDILEQGIVVYGLNKRIQFVNEYMKKVTGYADEQFINKSFSDLYITPELSVVNKQIFDIIDGKPPYPIEYSINLNGTGNIYHIRRKLKPIMGINDKVVGIIGMLEDVTEKEQMRERFEESNLLLQMFLKKSPIYAFIKEVKDNESRAYMFSNKYKELTGIDSDDIKGMKMEEIFSPELASKMVADDLLVVKENKILSFEENREGKDYLTIKFPIRLGKKILVAGYSIDISEMKKTEEKLRSMKDLLLSITNGATDLIYTKDLKGKYTSINKAFEKFSGRGRSNILGKDMTQVFDIPEDNNTLLENDKRVINQEKLVVTNELLKDYTGEERKVSITKGPIYDKEGKLIGLFGILRDNTELIENKELLEIKQRMDSLGTLAGGISHDFNNLLTGILGNLELSLLDKNLSERNKGFINTALQITRRASELVCQLQNLTDSSVSEKKIFDIHDVASEVFSLLKNAVNKIVDINIEFEKGSFDINGSESEIHQVLLNLGTNSKLAMSERGYKKGDFIKISAKNYRSGKVDRTNLPQGDYVHIFFQDSGKGMSEEVIRRAFEPMFTTRELGEVKGRGLGLAMVYNIIVKKHKGHISIESKEGKGTTFHIYLPKAEQEKEEKESIHKEVSRGTETILVIEDEEHIRTLVKTILEIHGYNVIFAVDGEDGLDRYIKESNNIDLVLLDLTMPKMGGKEVLDNIMQIKNDVKVLISSGNAFERGSESLGKAKGFVDKPYNIKKLLSSIREVIDKEKNKK